MKVHYRYLDGSDGHTNGSLAKTTKFDISALHDLSTKDIALQVQADQRERLRSPWDPAVLFRRSTLQWA